MKYDTTPLIGGFYVKRKFMSTSFTRKLSAFQLIGSYKMRKEIRKRIYKKLSNYQKVIRVHSDICPERHKKKTQPNKLVTKLTAVYLFILR